MSTWTSVVQFSDTKKGLVNISAVGDSGAEANALPESRTYSEVQEGIPFPQRAKGQ